MLKSSTPTSRFVISVVIFCLFTCVGGAEDPKRLNVRLSPGTDFVASLEFKPALVTENDDPIRFTFQVVETSQPLVMKRSGCFVFEESGVSHLPLRGLANPVLKKGVAVQVASQNKVLYVLIPTPTTPLEVLPKSSTVSAVPIAVGIPAQATGIDIQSIINSLGTTGGTVHLSTGTYPITLPITVPSNVTIEGDGSGTQIINNSADFAFRIEGVESLTTRITQDITRGGGVGAARVAIRVQDSGGFVAGDTVKIVKDNDYPVKTEFNKVFSAQANVITFQDNFIESYKASDNVKVVAVIPARNVAINNLSITSSPGTTLQGGVWAKNTTTLRLTNLRLFNLTAKSMQVEDSYLPRIENNTLVDNGRVGYGDWGLRINLSHGAVVTGNKLISSGAIVVDGNLHALVKNNHTDNTGQTGGDGFSIISTVGSTFDSNTVSRAKCYGIWMKYGSERNVLSGNHITSGVTTGIYVSDNSIDNSFCNNILTNNSGSGLVLAETAHNSIAQGNIANGNLGWGILVLGNSNVVMGNKLRLNGTNPLLVVEGQGNVTKDNF